MGEHPSGPASGGDVRRRTALRSEVRRRHAVNAEHLRGTLLAGAERGRCLSGEMQARCFGENNLDDSEAQAVLSASGGQPRLILWCLEQRRKHQGEQAPDYQRALATSPFMHQAFTPFRREPEASRNSAPGLRRTTWVRPNPTCRTRCCAACTGATCAARSVAACAGAALRFGTAARGCWGAPEPRHTPCSHTPGPVQVFRMAVQIAPHRRLG